MNRNIEKLMSNIFLWQLSIGLVLDGPLVISSINYLNKYENKKLNNWMTINELKN